MELYRITQEQYADDLSGNGARLFGGRWNSEGTFALYTSSSRSIALLETLAHTPAKMLEANNYQLITLSVPDNLVAEEIQYSSLPKEWASSHIHPFTKWLGDQFLHEGIHLMLAVPCVMLPEEKNYLLNPLHKDMKRVKIVHKRRIGFDHRVENHL